MRLIGNRIKWTIRVFRPSKLYTYWSHITQERQLSFLPNCEANYGLWNNDVPTSANPSVCVNNFVDEFYPWQLSILIWPFQCQMHISVKVHCGKTADSYSFTLQFSLTLMSTLSSFQWPWQCISTISISNVYVHYKPWTSRDFVFHLKPNLWIILLDRYVYKFWGNEILSL